MRTVEISKMIEKAVADEEQTGHLAGAVERVARQNGVHPDQQAIQGSSRSSASTSNTFRNTSSKAPQPRIYKAKEVNRA